MAKLLHHSGLLYGFELETQVFEGLYEGENAGDRELNDSEYCSWLEQTEQEIKNTRCLNELPNHPRNLLRSDVISALLDCIDDPEDEDDTKDIGDLYRGDDNPYLYQVFDTLSNACKVSLLDRLDYWVEAQAREEDIPDYCYYEENQELDICEVKQYLRTCTHRFTCETDGTVSGPEIQSGVCTLDQAKSAFRELYTKFDFEVDVKCSFHIHVSHSEVRHMYGKKMQYLQMRYLYDNMHRVPTSVLVRWTNENWLVQYFNIAALESRYAFVAYRKEIGQGTWEYRCFGNVSTTDEANACLDLAQDAFLNASRKRDRIKTPCDNDFFLLKKNLIARAKAYLSKSTKKAA